MDYNLPQIGCCFLSFAESGYISDDFSGNILDVPVGTAVFTEHKWLPRISR